MFFVVFRPFLAIKVEQLNVTLLFLLSYYMYAEQIFTTSPRHVLSTGNVKGEKIIACGISIWVRMSCHDSPFRRNTGKLVSDASISQRWPPHLRLLSHVYARPFSSPPSDPSPIIGSRVRDSSISGTDTKNKEWGASMYHSRGNKKARAKIRGWEEEEREKGKGGGRAKSSRAMTYCRKPPLTHPQASIYNS